MNAMYFSPFNKQFKTILALLFLLVSFNGFTQTKRGLIVAIGEYPEETKWRPINSVNDIPLVRSALQKQGFNSENIHVLKNEEATKQNIVNGIEDLIKATRSGDIVVLHFSSHGQQVEDLSGDELDGYDEAIVAYGAPAFYKEDYDFSQHLLDDELERLLEALQLKVGPTGDVIVFADACHSGTVSRGEAVSRGGMPAYQRPNYTPNKGTGDIGLFQNTTRTKIAPGKLAPLVVISASQAAEVNYEYNGAGSLSTAISKSVDKLNADMSYRGFFAQILKEMSVLAPSQRPAIEGDIDRLLFAGKVIEQEPYYSAYKIRDFNAYLYGGKLNGIYDGTELAVFPIGTTSTKGKSPLATGSAIFSEGTWCKIKLDKALDGNPEDYWFFVTNQSFGEIQLEISIDIRDNAVKNELSAVLGKSALFHLTKDRPDFILEDGGRGTIDIIRGSDGNVFAENLSSEDSFALVVQTLKQFSQGTFMKNLELSDPRFNVVFDLIPVRLNEEGIIIDTLDQSEISNNGAMVFTEDIGAIIRVRNLGEQDAYFSIIDIQPDGKINSILPGEDPELHQNPSDFLIQAGQTYYVQESVVYFGPPYGMEVFKLFASKEPIDFSPIITKKPRSRSKMSGLEILFDDTYEASSRGGMTQKIKSSGMEASTSYVSFEIASH